MVADRTRDIDIDRAAAQLAEGARQAGDLERCVSFSLPRLEDVRWLEPNELDSIDPAVLTVVVPQCGGSDDDELYARCRALLRAALEMHPGRGGAVP